MNAKKAKAIRRAMMSDDPTKSGVGFTTTAVYNEQERALHFRFTYHSVGERKVYKLGKKIYKQYGFLPKEQASGKDGLV
jgi:hypothetical protein